MTKHAATVIVTIIFAGLLCQPAMAADWPLNLTPFANRAFVDHGSGHGRRGWSAQGPQNSLHGMKPGLRVFSGIQFRILNPKTNHGAAVLTFDGAASRSRLFKAVIPVSERVNTSNKPLNLYLLHTACWASGPAGRLVGTIHVRYARGPGAIFHVRTGRDIADWWNPGDQSNARVAYTENNGSAMVGVYVSRFTLPAGWGRPRSITLQTAKGPVWIVLAASLSTKNVHMVGETQVIRAGPQWKPVNLNNLMVKRGTALDLSFLVPKPAGRYGFVHVNRRGQLVFADRPAQPVRFICDSYNMAVVQNTLAPFTKTTMNEFAQQEARMGINALRPHNLDAFLMDGSTRDGVLDAGQLKLWDYFSAALKKRGIYLFLDLTTYSLFNKDNIWIGGGAKRHFDTRIYWDPYVRRVWVKGVTELLDHVNPYTGLALKNNPQVVVLQTRNESTLFKFLVINHARPHPGLCKLFNQWLKKRYGSTVALRQAWTVRHHSTDTCYLPINEKLGNVQFPTNIYRGPAAKDFQRFCIDTDQNLFLWMQRVLKRLGARVPATDFNYIPSYDLTFTRDVLPLVDMHCYHEHPSAYAAPGSYQLGLSALNPQDPMGYLCTLAGARQWGKPFTVSETGEPFWNKWRFESGLCWPAMAALQGWNLVSQFGQAVLLNIHNPRCHPLQPFLVGLDPPNRAAQYMAALLYLRGDVKPSPHRIEMRLNRPKIIQESQGNNGVSTYLARLALLAGFGCRVTHDPRAAAVAPFHPNLMLTPTGGSNVALSVQASNVMAPGGGLGRLEAVVKYLKQQKILSRKNRTDVKKGEYESDTGQIFIDTRHNHIQVVTATSEGGTVLRHARMHLPGLWVQNDGTPAAIFLGALDRQRLQHSSRLLLIVAANAANSGMELRSHGQILERLGYLPVLARIVHLNIRIRHSHPRRLKLWALAFNGTRMVQIPLKVIWHDEVAAVINTGIFPGGPTPFFELGYK